MSLTWLERPGAFGWILAGSLAVRLGALAALAGRPFGPDSIHYHRLGAALAGYGAFNTFYPPGLPLYLAGIYRLTGPVELAGRAAMLAWWVLLALAVSRLGSELFSPRAANLAVLSLAVSPIFIWTSVETLTQLPAAALLAWSLCLAVRLVRGRAGLPGAAGLGFVLGWLALVRPSSLLAAGLLLLAALVKGPRRLGVIALAGAGVVMLAWTLASSGLTGRLVPVNDANLLNLYYGNNPYTPLYKTWWLGSHGPGEPGVAPEFSRRLDELAALPAAERSRELWGEIAAYLRARPDLFLLRTLNRARAFFAFDTLTGATLRANYGASSLTALAAIGLDALCFLGVAGAAAAYFFLHPFRPVGGGLLAAAGLAYALPYFFSFAHPTYHYPIVPLLALPAGAVLAGPGESLARLRSLPARRRWALLAALAVFAAVQVEWVLVNWGRV